MRKVNCGTCYKGFAAVLLTALVLCSAQPAGAQSETSVGNPLPPKEIPVALKLKQGAKEDSTEMVAVHTRYTFTGKGSWFSASNWENERIPPAALKPGEQVIICGTGPCMYGQATPFILGKGSSLEVKAGKTLYLSIGGNFVLRGGTLTNHGELKVLSGTLTNQGAAAGSKIVNTGKVNSTKLSSIDANIEQAPATTGAIPQSKATSKQ